MPLAEIHSPDLGRFVAVIAVALLMFSLLSFVGWAMRAIIPKHDGPPAWWYWLPIFFGVAGGVLVLYGAAFFPELNEARVPAAQILCEVLSIMYIWVASLALWQRLYRRPMSRSEAVEQCLPRFFHTHPLPRAIVLWPALLILSARGSGK